MTKAIITSASNKFFPSLINLLGSIEANYPNHPHIYIYDLGLFYSFRKELESMPKVTILKASHFVPFWRSCYTWKTYILNTPLADLNFYLDAGNQVLRPLDEIFNKIEDDGYFAVGQGKDLIMKNYVPIEYIPLLEIDKEMLNKEIMTAGIFGFKKDSKIKEITENLYQSGIAGLCLGFSEKELWKNKGVNKNYFVRNCAAFRHDTTLLSVFLYKNIENLKIQDVSDFSASKKENQLIWNMRLNYQSLEYLNPKLLSNKIFIRLFLFFKYINNSIKKS